MTRSDPLPVPLIDSMETLRIKKNTEKAIFGFFEQEIPPPTPPSAPHSFQNSWLGPSLSGTSADRPII